MAKEPSIKLSPKYGVNPTMPVCFFCGKETGEIALLGHIRKYDDDGRTVRGSDIEAPRSMVLNYEPCDECKKKMSLGITLVGISDTPMTDNRPPIQETPDGEKLYPTGHWLVVSENFINNNFDPSVKDRVLKQRTCLVPQMLIENIQNAYKEQNEEEGESIEIPIEDDKTTSGLLSDD